MANIFQGMSKEARCLRVWDEKLRTSEWVDTDVFAEIFDFPNLTYEEQESFRKAIKKAKKSISDALIQQGMCLREKRCETDNRKVLTAYPEYNKDPLHNMRIMAVIDNAINYSRALRLTYSPSFHDSEEHIFHPHYVRIYNGRQYVYGIYENIEENMNLPFVALPLDRIQCASITKEVEYRRGNTEYYEQLMRDIMGASPNFKNSEVIDVILRTHREKIHKLLLTKPLHHSIREIKPFIPKADGTPEQPGELMIHVQRSTELYNWLLHYGTGVEVISPDDVRAYIAHTIKTLNGYYNR